jgi:outer membrane protein
MYKFILIIFISIISFINLSYAEEKIAFIDIDKIINESEFGKKTYDKIDKAYENEKKKLVNIEKELIKKEKEILKQKNILSEDELRKKINALKKEVNDFQNKRNSTNEKYNQMKLEKTNYMVKNLNEILSKYSDENNISLVIQKKYIVIAKSGLDITDKVLDIFNKEVKK